VIRPRRRLCVFFLWSLLQEMRYCEACTSNFHLYSTMILSLSPSRFPTQRSSPPVGGLNVSSTVGKIGVTVVDFGSQVRASIISAQVV
jgi:hypothetical protein